MTRLATAVIPTMKLDVADAALVGTLIAIVIAGDLQEPASHTQQSRKDPMPTPR